MDRITRRLFLKLSALTAIGVSAVVLTKKISSLLRKMPQTEPPSPLEKTMAPPTTSLPTFTSPPRGSDGIVSVVRGLNVEEMLNKSLELIGFKDKVSVRGKKVLVKPNVNSNDPSPFTTNPSLVKAVIKYLYDSGASEVTVADLSGIPWQPTSKCFKATGIESAALEAQANIVALDNTDWVKISLEGAEYLKEVRIPTIIDEYDILVSLPVVKTHRYASYTMSLKNMVGFVSNDDRYFMHNSDYLEEMIAELNLAFKPELIVMDGTKSLVSGGPTSGDVVETNLLVSGFNRVAVDVVGLSIVKYYDMWPKVSSKNVWRQRQIIRAIEIGIGIERDKVGVEFETLIPDDIEFEELKHAIVQYLLEPL